MGVSWLFRWCSPWRKGCISRIAAKSAEFLLSSLSVFVRVRLLGLSLSQDSLLSLSIGSATESPPMLLSSGASPLFLRSCMASVALLYVMGPQSKNTQSFAGGGLKAETFLFQKFSGGGISLPLLLDFNRVILVKVHPLLIEADLSFFPRGTEYQLSGSVLQKTNHHRARADIQRRLRVQGAVTMLYAEFSVRERQFSLNKVFQKLLQVASLCILWDPIHIFYASRFLSRSA